MAKLYFKTKKPLQGYVDYSGEAGFQTKVGERNFLSQDKQSEVLDIINTDFRVVLLKLNELGFDMTTARFSINSK